MAYKDILQNLVESLPEIHGAFIYNEQHGVIISEEIIATNSIQKKSIGDALARIFFMMSDHFSDISSIRFRYKKATLIGRNFHENNYLIVLCGQDISTGMARVTMQMALNNLNEIDPSVLESLSAVAHQAPTTPEDLMATESPLAEPLNKIQQELSRLIGPVATVLVEDALIDWTKQVTPSLDNLDQLIQILIEMVGEGDESSEFRAKMNKIF